MKKQQFNYKNTFVGYNNLHSSFSYIGQKIELLAILLSNILSNIFYFFKYLKNSQTY